MQGHGRRAQPHAEAMHSMQWPYEDAQQEKEEMEPRQREGGELSPSSNIEHELWNVYGTIKCRRCARTFGEGEFQASRCYETCKGIVGGTALAALTGNANYMWADFALLAIDLIKQGSLEVSALLCQR